MNYRTPAALAFVLLSMTACSADEEQDSSESTAASSTFALSDRDQAYQDSVVTCLQDAGWAVEIDPADGGIYIPDGIPAEQASAYQGALQACQDPLNADVPTLQEITPEQWSDLYQQEKSTADCLRGEGIDVPEIPSEQVFVDRYQSGDPWTSYGFVGDVAQGTWTQLNVACPQPEL